MAALIVNNEMLQENKKMELLEKIRLALADRKLDKVAAQTGLHENTVRSIASGKNTNPTIATVEKLAAYLFGDKHELS